MEQQNGDPEANGLPAEETSNINGTTMKDKSKSPDISEGSDKNIQLSKIKILTVHHDEEEESGDGSGEEDLEEEIKPKKMVKKKKKKKKDQVAQPAEVLVKTFAQAIRMINEQKAKEKAKTRKEEIRRLALDQKRRQGGPGKVQIHVSTSCVL